jgi:hypothetical protein
MNRWALTAQLLHGNLAIELRDFLKDHGVPFEERRACGLVELTVRCTKADALRLADALQLLGTRSLFDGEESCLLVVRPGGAR